MPNESYDAWMAKLDRSVTNQVGVSVYDLPDAAYRDMYDDGLSARDAARSVISDNC